MKINLLRVHIRSWELKSPWFSLFAFLILAISPVLGSPTIFNSTETVQAGEMIGLQGDSFGSNASVLMAPVNTSGVVGAQTALSLSISSSGYLGAQIPAGTAWGLYEIWVKDSMGSTSPIVFLNRARITSFEFPEVEPGRQFRIFGRNLRVTGGTPSVRFIDLSTGVSTGGTVLAGGDGYVVTVQTPATLLATHAYGIYYQNGFGGSMGEVIAPTSLTIRTGGSDPFSLGLPWGADFANFPSHAYPVLPSGGDDTSAIQTAINSANSAGGGVVNLAAGTFHINTFLPASASAPGGGVGLILKSNVVVQGAGQTQTSIEFAAPTSVSATTAMIYIPTGASVLGLANLQIKCTTQLASVANLYSMVSTNSDTSRFFLKGVTLDGNKWTLCGLRLTTTTGGRFLLSGCTITNLRRSGKPLQIKDYGNALNQTQYVYVKNCTFPNQIISAALGGKNIIFEGNTLTFDGQYFHDIALLQPTETGLKDRISLSGPNHVILGNTFNYANGATYPYVNENDGENILAEDPGTNSYPTSLGTVGTATATSLSDSTQSWGTTGGGAYAGWNIVLVDGPGNGQVRTVVSNTATTLTIDTPWAVIPTASTKYSLNRLNVPHLLIKGNTIQDKHHTMYIYQGAYDIAVVGNTATNSNDLLIRAYTLNPTTTPPTTPVCAMLLNVLVADNILTATSSANPALLNVQAAYADSPLDPNDTTRFGTEAYLMEVRRNSVNAMGRVAFQAVDTFNYAISAWHPQGDGLPLAIQGAIFDGNTALNAQTAYGYVPGVAGFVVANSVNPTTYRMVYDLTQSDGNLVAGSWSGNGTLLNGSIIAGPVTVPQTMTIEGKFKVPLNQTIAQTIFGNRPAGAAEVSILAAGQLRAWDNSFSLTPPRVQSPTTLNNGNWHHFAWTSTGTVNQLYVDGVDVTPSGSANNSRASSAGTGTMGNYNGTGTFTGELAEIRVWNAVRTSSDILKFMNTRLAGDEPGLIQYWKLNETSGTVAKSGVLPTDFWEGLAGYWRFDESTGTIATDASGNGNNGTQYGSTPGWVTGIFGNALHFDGTTNYVSVPLAANFQGMGGLTVHARVKLDTIFPTWNANYQGIISQGDPSTAATGWELGTYGVPGPPVQAGFYFRRGSPAGAISTYGPTNLVAGQAYALAATYDPLTGATRLYVDGVLQTTTTSSQAWSTSTADLRIGSRASTVTGHYFQGIIDDARVYNLPLSAQDMAILHAP